MSAEGKPEALRKNVVPLLLCQAVLASFTIFVVMVSRLPLRIWKFLTFL